LSRRQVKLSPRARRGAGFAPLSLLAGGSSEASNPKSFHATLLSSSTTILWRIVFLHITCTLMVCEWVIAGGGACHALSCAGARHRVAVTGRRARTVLLADAAESVVSCGRVRATLSMGITALLASSLAFHSMLCAECRLAGHDFSLQKDGLESSRPRGPLSKRVRLKYSIRVSSCHTHSSPGKS
jgi:hypothetical protein